MNVGIIVAYDGSRFAGWQKNKNTGTKRTLQGMFEELLRELFGRDIPVRAAGRTDAGVNALGQVMQIEVPWKEEPVKLLAMLRKELADKLNPKEQGAVVLRELFVPPERFHCRFDARWKTYDYYFDERERESVFARAYTYPTGGRLDLAKMQKAAELLEGKHDFRAFSSVTSQEKETVRELYHISFERITSDRSHCELLRVSFTGEGFLYHMVRILAGTLLEVGRGERTPESIPALFQSGERSQSGVLLPAEALFLREVGYLDEN